MDRTAITPGKLYARLAQEFRRLRPGDCGNCRMPMVILTHRVGPDACNWTVESSSPLCGRCIALINAIVVEASEKFDLVDPVSVPYFPLPGRIGASPGPVRFSGGSRS
jgi:hypothetical protein